ncbi:MAG: serine hydrolase domain-containing protein, partial [Chryseobacterium taeanense]
MKKFILAFGLYITTCNLFFAQLQQKIDSVIQKEFSDLNGPGGAFLVSQKGKTIYEKAFGKANLELDVKMTPENVFQIGSMTKQFTAVSILILESQGKLKVSDAISKYIPDYPAGNSI